MENNKTPKSLSILIGELTKKVRLYIVILLLFFGSSFVGLLLIQINSALCSLTEAKMEKYLSAITREQALEEPNVARNIFNKFKEDLRSKGVIEKLELVTVTGGDEKESCSPKIFSSKYYVPLVFGNETVGAIKGSIRLVPIPVIAITLLVLAIGSVVSFGLLRRTLIGGITENLVQPFLRLSRDETIPAKTVLLKEVLDIQQNISQLKTKVIEAEKSEMRELRAIALGQQAEQVAHDIRSPLAALDVILSDIDLLPEDSKLLIKSATQRIRDIANNLLKNPSENKSLDEAESSSPQFIAMLIDSIMSEKRAQFKGKRNLFFEFDINKANFFLNAMIGPQTFKRLISNLLNNAIEAFNDGGQIKIGLFKNGSNILIKVQDNGKGIPKDVVTKIGERGFTFLKGKTEGGSGLGIYHAKTNLKRWNGSLQVESEEGRGTTITIEIPQSDPPSWFIGTLAVKTNSKVAILDDDPSIHEVWETRFKDLPKPFELLHFRRTDSFRDWQQNNRADLYLVDFELQGGATGLDLIQEYNLSQFAVLVTSKYEEPQVQAKCTQFRILMLPKLLASLVNIEYEIIS